MHIVGPFSDFPLQPKRSYTPPEETLEDYRAMAAVVGIERCVIVQPSCYGFDNRCTLAAVKCMAGRARAVMVFDPATTTCDEIAEMNAGGACALRIQLVSAGGLDLRLLETAISKIVDFGWHFEICLDARQIPDLENRLRALPVPIVFDHMAHMDAQSRESEAGFEILLDLLGSGNAWVKLSNGFFAPSAARARALIAANPERVLWGTDWPHLGFRTQPPDDGQLFDLLSQWAPDAALRQSILVTNPTALYFRKHRHD